MDLTDEALITNFRQTRDSNYFRSLVQRYELRLYNAAYRILGNAEEAEEVVQDTYMKLHKNLAKFRSQTTFAAWLFRIAHNACLDKMRMKQRRGGFALWSFDAQSSADKTEEELTYVISQAADEAPNPAERMDLSEQGTIVAESLRLLPETQRTVVVLHDIEDFSYQEIAEIVGTSMGTVRSRLHYGRLKLKELLEPYFESREIPTASR